VSGDLPVAPFKGKALGPVFSLQSTDDEDEDWEPDITTKQPARRQVGFDGVSDAEEGKIEELDDQKDEDNTAFGVSPRKETALQVTPARPGVKRHSGHGLPYHHPYAAGWKTCNTREVPLHRLQVFTVCFTKLCET
jgi:hypothetical protein